MPHGQRWRHSQSITIISGESPNKMVYRASTFSAGTGTWEWEQGGGGSREMAGTRGAGRKHEGLPNGLSGETGTWTVLSHCTPCLTSIRKGKSILGSAC
jgi:hypothetical protein